MYQVFYILIDGFEKIIYLLLAFSSLEFSSSEKSKKKNLKILEQNCLSCFKILIFCLT